MVGEEIKHDKRGREGEGSRGTNPGKREDSWQGNKKESSASVSVLRLLF